MERRNIFILLISFVYFIEIALIGFTFSFLMHPVSVKRRIWFLIAVIEGGFVVSIILQNVLASSQ